MPAESGKQYRFMQLMVHGKKKKGKGVGPSPEVAKEMIEKTPAHKRSKWSKKSHNPGY
jgi:hypothetical protein